MSVKSAWLGLLASGAVVAAAACFAIVLAGQLAEAAPPIQQKDALASAPQSAASEPGKQQSLPPLARIPETAVLGGAAAPADTSGQPKVSLQWRGNESKIKQPTMVAITNFRAWSRLWGQHAPGSQVPRIDFSRFMAVAVFQGSDQSQQCCIKIKQISREAGALRVTYGFDPAPPSAVGPFSSYNIKIIPWTDAFVDFVRSDRP